MEYLIEYLDASFYTLAIAIGFAIVGLIVAIYKFKNNSRISKLFIIYFVSYILLNIVILIDPKFLFYNSFYFEFVSNVDLIFTIIEFFIFVIFFKIIFLKPLQLKLLIVITYVFLSLVCGLIIIDYVTFSKLSIKTLQSIFTIQAVCVIIPCVLYYLDIYRSQPDIILTNDQRFWIVTGITFFMVCTLPFSIFINYLNELNIVYYKYLYSIFYIFYVLLFTMIIRSFLCKTEIAK